MDGDGILQYGDDRDVDVDGNGLLDNRIDTDVDGIYDDIDVDIDADGLLNRLDPNPYVSNL